MSISLHSNITTFPYNLSQLPWYFLQHPSWLTIYFWWHPVTLSIGSEQRSHQKDLILRWQQKHSATLYSIMTSLNAQLKGTQWHITWCGSGNHYISFIVDLFETPVLTEGSSAFNIIPKLSPDLRCIPQTVTRRLEEIWGAGEGKSHNKVNLRPGFGCVTLSISFDHQGSSLLKAKDEEIGPNSLYSFFQPLKFFEIPVSLPSLKR